MSTTAPDGLQAATNREHAARRGAWVDVDLGAIRSNVVALAEVAAPASLLAVVKGDAYGHGAVPVARAALEAGAQGLGVATLGEAEALRAAGITAPILLLSEVCDGAVDAAVQAKLALVVCTPEGIEAAAAAARAAGEIVAVHLKIDTGMRRMGCDPVDSTALARRVASDPYLSFEGVMTHLAIADEPDDPFTDLQLDRFDSALSTLEAEGLRPRIRHAANSAATIAFPRARYDQVRVGIAVYGLAPSPALAGRVALEPALSLRARVSALRRVDAGEGVSYGLAWRAPEPTVVATLPLGYADGVPRRLGAVGGEVLVGGSRCAIAGTVTMDQIMVDVGSAPVRVGDEAVLIGTSGDETIGAQDWADRLGTISYEIVAQLGPRLPRSHHG